MNFGAQGLVFHVPPRTRLSFNADDWCYGNIPNGPLTISVERVRWELARHYDTKVWLDGYETDVSGVPFRWVEMLVHVDALRRLTDGRTGVRKAG